MYINSFCSISPSGTLNPQSDISLLNVLSGAKTNCVEPDYKDLIPPMQLRRMSKPVRTGVSSAKLCMKSYHDFMPASIHVGTAYGMLDDSESFLKKIIEQDEQLLNPTAFIQSTHNTVSGQIALSIGCTAHNMTYVHNAHSFESALLDASLMMENLGDNDSVLVGAVEECTATSFNILSRFNVYNETNTAGEGASFFALSKMKQAESIAELRAFDMFIAKDETELKSNIEQFIEQHHLNKETDLLLHSFDDEQTFHLFKNRTSFVKYSGKYATMAAFGVAYACLKIKEKQYRNIVVLTGLGTHYSIIFLSEL